MDKCADLQRPIRSLADLLQTCDHLIRDGWIGSKPAHTGQLGAVGKHLLELPHGRGFHDGNATLDIGGRAVRCQGRSRITAGGRNALRLTSRHHVGDGGGTEAVLVRTRWVGRLQFEIQLGHAQRWTQATRVNDRRVAFT